MGVDADRKFRVVTFVLASLMTGVLVAVSGPIGFVGLILPHAVRLLVAATIVGHCLRRRWQARRFLVLADIAARTLASPQEIPVGVLTALCGGPFFLWLIRRDARRGAVPVVTGARLGGRQAVRVSSGRPPHPARRCRCAPSPAR